MRLPVTTICPRAIGWLFARISTISRGQIVVTGNRISVEVTELIRKAEVVREPGIRIGAHAQQHVDRHPGPPEHHREVNLENVENRQRTDPPRTTTRSPAGRSWSRATASPWR
jgi:hypothetical protein